MPVQDVAPGGKINWHTDSAAFDKRFIQQYAAADATFVARFDIAAPS